VDYMQRRLTVLLLTGIAIASAQIPSGATIPAGSQNCATWSNGMSLPIVGLNAGGNPCLHLRLAAPTMTATIPLDAAGMHDPVEPF